jgi:hypothetical protein
LFPSRGGPPFKKGGQNIAVARCLFIEMSRRDHAHRLYVQNMDFIIQYTLILMIFLIGKLPVYDIFNDQLVMFRFKILNSVTMI